MKKNLLTLGVLITSLSASAQIVNVIGTAATGTPSSLFYIGEGALVYSGGGVQTKGNGLIDVHGNMMIVGTSSDVLITKKIDGTTDKTDGGNIILRLNTPANYALPNTLLAPGNYTYGQLFISGLSQGNINGFVDQEYRNVNHGAYQQIALPFSNKQLSTLSTELGKTFSNTRYSGNEILKYDNSTVVFDNYSLSNTLSDPTGYYILGNKNNNTLDVSTITRTLRGIPYADGTALSVTLQNAGKNNIWNNGNATNSYNEKYNTYVQDGFEIQAAIGGTPWQGNFGRNLYQFGNPFLTNLDLRNIFINEGPGGDGVFLSNIYGIRLEQAAGTVSYQQNVGGGAGSFRYVTWSGAAPVGDVDWLIVRPGSVFTIKLKSNIVSPAIPDKLNFNNLRRFNYTPRTGTNYSVTSAKSGAGTLKQLGVLALDINGNEIGRTYYAVSPEMVSGHASNTDRQVASSSSNIIGTYEEEPINGGYDLNLTSSYWLYINEANENNFVGKPIPAVLYSSDIKFLKFEIREDAELVPTGTTALSAGKSFYYQLPNGSALPIAQGQTIPIVASNDGTELNLYYGAPSNQVLSTNEEVKPSRTVVVYNPAIDNYIVRFDSNWKKADVEVYDMAGRLIISGKNVKVSEDFIINLSKNDKGNYLVTVTSEKGQKFSTKILR